MSNTSRDEIKEKLLALNRTHDEYRAKSNIVIRIDISPANSSKRMEQITYRDGTNDFTHDRFFVPLTNYKNMYLNTVASAYLFGLGLHLHVEDFLNMIMDIVNLYGTEYKTYELFQSMEASFASSSQFTTQLSRIKRLSKTCTDSSDVVYDRGSPTVIYLHGTEKDWPHLEYKLINIRRYFEDNADLVDRLSELLPILRNISDSYRGVVNVEFWNNMLGENGWFNKFIPSINGSYSTGISKKNNVLVGAFGVFQYEDGSLQTIRGYVED